ncbi:MAG: hypothetical protein GXP14_02275 [Gammaproteobacteria bacterium]|nr:hypothetical protein [Gammaproteobacteria bacterium]
MMDMMSNGHGSMMDGMWFFSILFWVLIIVGVIFITKWFLERNRNKNEPGINEKSALDILNLENAVGRKCRMQNIDSNNIAGKIVVT